MSITTDDAQIAPIPVVEVPTTTSGPGVEPDPVDPQSDWSFRKLEDYIRERLAAGERQHSEALRLGKRSAVEVWYAGKALDVVREKRTTKGAWVSWLESHELNRDTCYQAMRLFQRAESVDDVRELTLTEARKKYRTNRGELWSPPPGEGEHTKKKIAAKPAATRTYNETPRLAGIRERMEGIAEEVKVAVDADWKNADPAEYFETIDETIEQLRAMKRAIREAQKTANQNDRKAAAASADRKKSQPALVRSSDSAEDAKPAKPTRVPRGNKAV